MKSNDTQIAVMANDIEYIKKKIDEISVRLEKEYIHKNEFDPVKRIVYGLVGLILVAVVGGLLTLILR